MIKQKRSSNKKYKIIFFDWNKTLSYSKFWGHLENDLKQQDFFARIDRALFNDLEHLLDPWMRGGYRAEEVVKILADNLKVQPASLLDQLQTSCQNMQFVSSKIIKQIKTIKKSGLKVVIATDNMDTFVRWTVPSLKLKSLFDDVLDSWTLKALKKDFRSDGSSLFFSDFLRKNKIRPDESILIDDAEDQGNKIASFGISYRRVSTSKDTELIMGDILGNL